MVVKLHSTKLCILQYFRYVPESTYIKQNLQDFVEHVEKCRVKTPRGWEFDTHDLEHSLSFLDALFVSSPY